MLTTRTESPSPTSAASEKSHLHGLGFSLQLQFHFCLLWDLLLHRICKPAWEATRLLKYQSFSNTFKELLAVPFRVPFIKLHVERGQVPLCLYPCEVISPKESHWHSPMARAILRVCRNEGVFLIQDLSWPPWKTATKLTQRCLVTCRLNLYYQHLPWTTVL